MKTFLHVKAKGAFFLCLFAFLPLFAMEKEFVIYDTILEERTAQKIEEMGRELFSKSGIKVILVAKEKGGEDIKTFQQNFAQTQSTPFVLLTLFLAEQKVDIYHSQGLEKTFDKEAILSPLPWRGTIIPLLTTKKTEVGVSPALLNGYADIVDQIAASHKIELESSIGSSNKTTMSVVKILIYGFVAILVLLAFYRRMKKRHV
jgi:uncharacterized membrane protein YgcG